MQSVHNHVWAKKDEVNQYNAGDGGDDLSPGFGQPDPALHVCCCCRDKLHRLLQHSAHPKDSVIEEIEVDAVQSVNRLEEVDMRIEFARQFQAAMQLRWLSRLYTRNRPDVVPRLGSRDLDGGQPLG